MSVVGQIYPTLTSVGLRRSMQPPSSPPIMNDPRSIFYQCLFNFFEFWRHSIDIMQFIFERGLFLREDKSYMCTVVYNMLNTLYVVNIEPI